MKIDTIVDGLSDLINDYIAGDIDSVTAEMLEDYLKENEQLAVFVKKAQAGKIALKNAYHVVAADDFEEKLAQKIARLNIEKQMRVNLSDKVYRSNTHLH